MKQIKIITTALLAALLLTSCGKETPTCGPGVPEAPTEITTNGLTQGFSPSAGEETYFTGSHQSPVQNDPQEHLSDRFAPKIDRIILINGMTGARITLTDPAEIDRIAAFCEPIVGTNPESNRGYYGFHYSITLYNGPIQLAHIGFMNENHPGEAAYTAGHYETVNGHDYAIRYRMSGRSTVDVLDFFGRYFPSDTATTAETTANHVWGTAQDWSEVSPTTDGFDYSSLTLPDYRTINPVRYMDEDEMLGKYNGWQYFGHQGEIRTIPQPMRSTYTYQMYSYYIRNDIEALYSSAGVPLPDAVLWLDPTWLTDTTSDGSRLLWYSMGTLPDKVTLVDTEATGSSSVTAPIFYAHYQVTEGDTTRDWLLYFIKTADSDHAVGNNAAVFAVRVNEQLDTVKTIADSIAKSYVFLQSDIPS